MDQVRVMLAASNSGATSGGRRASFNCFDLSDGPCGQLQSFLAYRLQDAGFSAYPFAVQTLPHSPFYHTALCADVGELVLLDPSLSQFQHGFRCYNADLRCSQILDTKTSPVCRLLSQQDGIAMWHSLRQSGYADLTPTRAKSYLSVFVPPGVEVMPGYAMDFMMSRNTPPSLPLMHCRDEVNIWMKALYLPLVTPGRPQTRDQEINHDFWKDRAGCAYGIVNSNPKYTGMLYQL